MWAQTLWSVLIVAGKHLARCAQVSTNVVSRKLGASGVSSRSSSQAVVILLITPKEGNPDVRSPDPAGRDGSDPPRRFSGGETCRLFAPETGKEVPCDCPSCDLDRIIEAKAQPEIDESVT